MSQPPKKLVAALRRKNNFLITSHLNLEGDALGSEIAVYWLLRKLGKRALIVNDDRIPYGYEFFPETKIIRRFRKSRYAPKFDCLLLVDCSDLKRCGEISQLNLKNKFIINIDHHIGNDNFGQINWVEPDASSASELIYKLYKTMDIKLDQNSAAALYAGMLTDTGSFRYSNTSAFTHRAVAELMECGINIRKIHRNIYESVPFSDMQLLSKILPTMKRAAGGKIIWFALKRALLKVRKISFDLSEHILSFGRAINGVEVVVLFKENFGANEVRMNLRSQGKVDVNKIARHFGGGGHKTASGCTLSGRIENIEHRVLAKIKAAIER